VQIRPTKVTEMATYGLQRPTSLDRRRRPTDHDGSAAPGRGGRAVGFLFLVGHGSPLATPTARGPAASILEGYVTPGALAA
jgi:hypothetical protein